MVAAGGVERTPLPNPPLPGLDPGIAGEGRVGAEAARKFGGVRHSGRTPTTNRPASSARRTVSRRSSNDRRAGLRRDAAQPALGGQGDGLRTDRRAVGTPFLARFLGLDQHAAWPVAAQSGDPAQQRVGALDRLDPEHQPLLHDRRLTDIERADRPRDLHAAPDIRRCQRVGPHAAERSFRQGGIAEEVVGPKDTEPLALQLLDDRRQEPVIAQCAIADLGEEFRGTPVGTQRGERGAAHAAGQYQLADPMRAQYVEPGRRAAETTPGMRHALDGCPVCFALQRENENLPPGRAAALDQPRRQAAIAGNDPERTGHSVTLRAATPRRAHCRAFSRGRHRTRRSAALAAFAGKADHVMRDQATAISSARRPARNAAAAKRQKMRAVIARKPTCATILREHHQAAPQIARIEPGAGTAAARSGSDRCAAGSIRSARTAPRGV